MSCLPLEWWLRSGNQVVPIYFPGGGIKGWECGGKWGNYGGNRLGTIPKGGKRGAHFCTGRGMVLGKGLVWKTGGAFLWVTKGFFFGSLLSWGGKKIFCCWGLPLGGKTHTVWSGAGGGDI